MLNCSNQNNANIKINAVSGTITRNYQKSFFIRFQMGSQLSRELLCNDAKIGDRKAVVIQCMCAGGKNGDEIIAEVMWKDDFDTMFEHEKDEPKS